MINMIHVSWKVIENKYCVYNNNDDNARLGLLNSSKARHDLK